MTTRLTDTRVASLRPGVDRIDVTDPSTRGLQLRIETNGRKVWLFRYKWKKKPVRVTLGAYPGTKLKHARDLAGECRRQLDTGIDPRRARPVRRSTPNPSTTGLIDAHSMEHLAAEFMERFIKPNRKRPEYAKRIIDTDVLPHWSGRDARTITPREIIERLDAIVARGAPVQANRTAAILSQMFLFGVHRAIVEDSPVKLLYRPGGKEKSRERTFTDDELKAFLKHREQACRFHGHMPSVLMVLLLTLQRRSELGLAEWSEFDFKEKLWRIPDEHAKGGRGHTLPLADWAIDELKILKRLSGRSRFVLPTADGSGPADPKLITRSVARCQTRFKKHGVEAFTAHDLRRTGRTAMARLGVSTAIAERVLNHAREKIEGTYDLHGYMDEKRAALERWEAHLRALERA